MIKCKKCGYEHENESNVDLHHVVPKVLGGKDIDGRMYLCGENKGCDCHRVFHVYLRENQEIKDLLKKVANKWLNKI